MARLWTTGAESQSTTNGIEVTTVYGATIDTTTKHAGAASWKCAGSIAATDAVGFDHVFNTTGSWATTFYRWYVYIDTLKAGTACYMDLYNGATNAISISIENVSGTLTATPYYNNFASSLSTFTLSSDAWHYIEVEYDTSPADGSEVFKVRLDGVEQSASSSLTLTTKTITIMSTGCYNSTGSADADTIVYFDDLAANSNSGSYQNSYPGEGYVVHMKPNAAGDSNTWEHDDGSAGDANNYTEADETTPDSATTYLARDTAVSNQPADLYNIESSATVGIGASDTINLIAIGSHGGSTSNTSAAGRNLNIGIKHGGTEYWSGSIDYSINGWVTHGDSGPKIYKYTYYVDPGDSGAWTASDLDSLQIGVRANSAATTVVRFSTVWALVEYVPAAGAEEEAEVSPVSLAATLPSVTATYASVLDASVSPLSATLSLPTVTATYVAAYNASVSPVSLTLTPPAVTATHVSVWNASVSAVSLTLGAVDPTATFIGVWNAGASPVTTTLSLPSVTATYVQEETASVNAVAITASLPSVTATYVQQETASVSPAAITLSPVATTATYQAVTTASVTPVSLTLTLPSVTAESQAGSEAEVAPVSLTLSVNTVTATYVQQETASVSPLSANLTVVAVTASYVQEETASTSPVGLALSVVDPTATYAGVWNAGVSPTGLTLTLPSITALYSGPSISDQPFYDDSLTDPISVSNSISGSVFYDDSIPDPSTDLNSIADDVIYDEGTEWGGGDI